MIRNREWPQPGSGSTVTRSTAGDWIRGIRWVTLLDECGRHWLTSSRTVHIPPSTPSPHELTTAAVLERDRRLTGHTFGSREHHVAPPGYELTSAWRVRALTRSVGGSDTHLWGTAGETDGLERHQHACALCCGPKPRRNAGGVDIWKPNSTLLHNFCICT